MVVVVVVVVVGSGSDNICGMDIALWCSVLVEERGKEWSFVAFNRWGGIRMVMQ